MPNRPSSHVIDDEGQTVLRGLLPPTDWLLSEVQKDYGKDYLVEVSSEEKLTGEIFHIQLKSTKSPNYIHKKSEISVPLDQEHLVYYFEKCREPVFLVVVDVSSKSAYYLFVQKYCSDKLGGSDGIRSKKTRTLHVSTANRLSDVEAFKSDVKEAFSIMCEMHPGSVSSAVQSLSNRLEKQDPRFRYEINTQGGVTGITLHPKVTVPCSMSITGNPEDVHGKITDMIERGVPVNLSKEHVEITGSPIFTGDFAKPILVHVRKQMPLSLTVSLLDESNNTVARLPEFRGSMEGGTVYQRFHAKIEGCPLEGHIEFTTNTDKTGRRPVKFVFSWIHDAWIGKPFRYLPYYDEVKKFIDMLKSASSIVLSFASQGNAVTNTVVEIPDSFRVLAEVSGYLGVLDQCRDIDKFFDLKANLSATISESDYEDIQELHGLVSRGKYVRKTQSCDLEFDYTAVNTTGTVEDEPNGILNIEGAVVGYRFMGNGIQIAGLGQQFQGGKVKDLGPIEDQSGERRARICGAQMTVLLDPAKIGVFREGLDDGCEVDGKSKVSGKSKGSGVDT